METVSTMSSTTSATSPLSGGADGSFEDALFANPYVTVNVKAHVPMMLEL